MKTDTPEEVRALAERHADFWDRHRDTGVLSVVIARAIMADRAARPTPSASSRPDLIAALADLDAFPSDVGQIDGRLTGKGHRTLCRIAETFRDALTSEPEPQPVAEGWVPPEKGEFLAENKAGDWLRVTRYDCPWPCDDPSAIHVINWTAGRWWPARRFMPLPASPHLAEEGQ